MGKRFRITCEKCGNEWWVSDNSGHAICPVCKTQPEGEPEPWDGWKWVNPVLLGNLEFCPT